MAQHPQPSAALAFPRPRENALADERDALERKVEQLAHALSEHTRAEAALRDEVRMHELLGKTGAILSSKLDLVTLGQALAEAATRLCTARFGAFYLRVSGGVQPSAPGKPAFRLAGMAGSMPACMLHGQPPPPGLVQTVEQSEPARWDDIGGDARFDALLPLLAKEGMELRSLLVTPVHLRSGKPIGALLFGHPQAAAFNERSERMMAAVASQAAVALDNARHHEAAQREVRAARQQLEQERTVREGAERAGEEKTAVIATLVRELRMPLEAILDWSQALRSGVQEEEARQAAFDAIERNVQVQARLLDDAVKKERIASGTVPPQ